MNKDYWIDRYSRQGRATVGHAKFKGDELRRKTDLIRKKMLPVFRDYFSGRRVLDFGCGYGRMSRLLVEAGARVIGIDIVDWAIEQARVYVPGAQFLLYDGKTIPFPDETFTGAFSWTVLQHVPNAMIGRTADEISRVLAPEGVFLLYENTACKENKDYLWFRDSATYMRLFETRGFRRIHAEPITWVDETDEIHIFMVMVKR